MAEPASAAQIATKVLGAASNLLGPIEALDAYLSLVDPAEGCKVEAEPFVLTRPPTAVDPAPVDKNKRLRPEGAKKPTPAKTPEAAAPNQVTALAQQALVTVSTRVSELDFILGERQNPTARVSLAAWRLADKLVCVPFLSKLSGFDSRVGNQVSFTCQAADQIEGVVVLTTRILFNPFMSESGIVTIWHGVTIEANGGYSVRMLARREAPEKVFSIGGEPEIFIRG